MICRLASNIISSVVTLAVVGSLVIYALRQTDNYDKVVPRAAQEVIQKVEQAAKEAISEAAPKVQPYFEQVMPQTKTVAVQSNLRTAIMVVSLISNVLIMISLGLMFYFKVIAVPSLSISPSLPK
jgi:ABC-type transport system involved in cytochrome bd biosynthesis fused ATPase/permease subunit